MQYWMKMAWFQTIRGGGMSNLGLWGKNPCVTTLFCLPPSLVSSNPFNVLFWVVGVVIVVGVAGLSVPFPRAHSTHDCIHSPLPCLLGFWRCPFIFLTWRGSLFIRMLRPFSRWSVCSHVRSSTFMMEVYSFLLSMACLFLPLVYWFACIGEAVYLHAQARILT